jgi:hypoxanthine phosphoribosyltransferase
MDERNGEKNMNGESKMYQDLDRILVNRDEIREKVKELGKRITEDYKGKSPVMVCILKGACMFFTDLIREVDLPLSIDFMAISSYGKATKTSGVVRVLKDLDQDVLGKDVIIVEDIVDTGVTLSYLMEMLVHRGAASLKVAALLDKTARRKVPDLKVDYVCFDIPDAFVVGYGLDFDQKYRNLPDIGVLSPKVYGDA